MALIHCQFYAETLKLATSMMVILPQQLKNQTTAPQLGRDGKFKTLYLLHGLSDDHTIWTRRTSIERYVTPLGIAVVMPAVQRSFYTDMAYGGAYETFIATELPQIVRSFFPLSDARADNYVAGQSMGGYGAFKMALHYPQNYCAAASLSGALDIAAPVTDPTMEHRQDFINVFGAQPNIADTPHDLLYAARQLIATGQEIPRLFQCCGDADYLYQNNLAFRDFATQAKLPVTWRADAGYAHTWDYWDLRIQTVLAWMFAAAADNLKGR